MTPVCPAIVRGFFMGIVFEPLLDSWEKRNIIRTHFPPAIACSKWIQELAVIPQENADVRPLPEYEAEIDRNSLEDDAVCAALAWHDGDARATIATLLADCADLRGQLALARSAMGRGFTRGWDPLSRWE